MEISEAYKFEPGNTYVVRVSPDMKPEVMFDFSHTMARRGIEVVLIPAEAGEFEVLPNGEKTLQMVKEHVQAVLAEVAGCADAEMREKIVEIRERY